MSSVSITKIFSFEAAHALTGYNGPCRNIHGHSYKLWVTIYGPVNPHTGMILDFNDLKKIVYETVISQFDHSLILSVKDKMLEYKAGAKADNLVELPFNPSSENLVIHFSELIGRALPETVKLYRLKLYETDTSFTEWYANDGMKLHTFKNHL